MFRNIRIITEGIAAGDPWRPVFCRNHDRFCFVPHALNTTVGEWTVPYTDITAVSKGKKIRSIAVHTKEGTVEEFVVNNRREWMKIICRFL